MSSRKAADEDDGEGRRVLVPDNKYVRLDPKERFVVCIVILILLFIPLGLPAIILDTADKINPNTPAPTPPTLAPTLNPTLAPTLAPTLVPTKVPTKAPTLTPT